MAELMPFSSVVVSWIPDVFTCLPQHPETIQSIFASGVDMLVDISPRCPEAANYPCIFNREVRIANAAVLLLKGCS